MKNKKIIISILVLAILAIISIPIIIFRNYIFANAPERTVMNFLGTIENQKFDESLKYIWPSERDKITTSSNILESVSNISDSRVQIKFSKLQYKTLKFDKNSAEINAKGKLNYQFFNALKEIPFDRNFKLIKENKTWYIKSLF